jgi:ABC-2 type transport system ATP-binding protein
MGGPIVETHLLTKMYGDFTAVDSLDLKVDEGEIFGFLGPNGAGKTTTILMLMGLSVPSSGTALVAGYDIVDESKEVRAVASILPEYSNLYGDLTAWQNLDFVGRLNDLPQNVREERIMEMLEIVGMTKWKESKLEDFSRGMKQRINIASALIKRPKIVFLDEPSLGLDPIGTKEIRELILQLNREQGLTVILTSHLLNEVQLTCDRVGIINHGKLVVTESMDILTQSNEGGLDRNIEFKLSEMPSGLEESLRAIDGVTSVTSENDRLYVYANEDCDFEVSKTIMNQGVVILMMKPKEYTLEDVFIKYSKEDA